MNAALAKIRAIVLRLEPMLAARLGGDLVLSDRVKMLVSAAVAILILFGFFGMQQIVSGLEHRYIKAQSDMTRLRAQVETDVWKSRKQQSQVLKSLLEERLWTAQTPGLADASFERWLRDRLSPHKMNPLAQIQVRRVPANKQPAQAGVANPLADIHRMTAKLVLPFDGAGLAEFLGDVADGDKAVVVDRLVVRAGRNARVEIDVSAFFRSHEQN